MPMDDFSLCREFPAYASVDKRRSDQYENSEILDSSKLDLLSEVPNDN